MGAVFPVAWCIVTENTGDGYLSITPGEMDKFTGMHHRQEVKELHYTNTFHIQNTEGKKPVTK